MNRKIRILLMIAASLLMFVGNAYANDNNDIKVIFNGEPMQFDQPPIIQDGRTLVPMRAIFEAIGAEVTWDESTQEITATKKNIELKGTFPKKFIRGINVTFSTSIGSTIVYINNEASLSLDVAPIITDTGRTLVPIRAVSETFGCDVDWNDESKTVIVNYDDSVEKKWIPCAEGSMSRPILSIDTAEPVYFDTDRQYDIYKYKRTADIEKILDEYTKDLIRLGFANHLSFSWEGKRVKEYYDAFRDEEFRDVIGIEYDEDPDYIIIYQSGALG